MENKIYLKKSIIKSIITSIIFILIFIIINKIEYKKYSLEYNKKINSLSKTIQEQYPNIKESDVIEILKTDKEDNLKQYGIDIKEESIINKNNIQYKKIQIIKITILIIFITIINYIYLKYNNKKDKKISELTKLVDDINHRKYKIEIDEDEDEDELSILKHEIYKTTLMLREQADNSLKDKKELKKSIDDISHQLKTPLTSILINIDNITDNPNIDNDKKDKFIREIKRETYNIKSLVETLLKLSKFDVNTIEFNNKKIKVKELINNSVQKVSALADLKNIKININCNPEETINCDINWQVEAISNIIKNGIEHSKENSKIDINTETNNIYSKIEITNYGNKIDDNDQKHIFERFYKGKNSKEDSVGIGLALAKTIIEKNNGRITINSNDEKTTFIIKYFSTHT